jgi:hypothetical protein
MSELREAARQFHNLTQGDASVVIRPPSAEKRDAIVTAGERLRAALTAPEQPIPMILHCPKCHAQHIDAPCEPRSQGIGTEYVFWDNPPHRSHLCHYCGTIWRPADVCTTGVEKLETRGKADNWSPQ